MRWVKKLISAWTVIDKVTFFLFVLFNVMLVGILYCNMQLFYLDAPYFILHCRNMGVWSNFFHKAGRINLLVPTIILGTSKYISINPAIHFLVQWTYWFIGILGGVRLLGFFEKKLWKRLLVISLLFLCSTFAENMFTLGKHEIMLNTCIIFFLYGFYGTIYKERQARYLIIYEISILLALITKETALIIIVPVFIMAIYSFIWNKMILKRSVIALVVIIADFILYSIYKYFYFVSSEYTTYSFSIYTTAQNVLWYVEYHMDIILFGVLGLVCLIAKWLKNKSDGKIAFLLAINITGWCYLVAISMWRWTMSYYIYCMVVFFSIPVIEVTLISNKFLKVIIESVVMLFIISASIYNYKVAYSHIDLGKAFTESLKSIEANTIDGSKVFCENYNFYEEPVLEANYVLAYDGCNTKIYGVNQEVTGIELDKSILDLYGYSIEQYFDLKPILNPKEGDYLLIYLNNRNFRGPIRGVNPSFLQNEDGKSFYTINGNNYSLTLVDRNEYKRKWLSVGDPSGGIFNDSISGYMLYRIDNIGIAVSGLYQDGWSGKEVTVSGIGDKDVIMHVGTIATSWKGKDTNTINIYPLDGDECIASINVRSGDLINISKIIKEKTDKNVIKLEIAETDSPRNYGSDDTRELGMILQFVEE